MLRILLALLFAMCAWPAHAHESLPMVVAVEERAEGVFALRLQLPPAIDARQAPRFVMPQPCARVDGVDRADGTGLYRCGELGGASLSWRFRDDTPAIPTLVRLTRLSGEEHVILARPTETKIVLPVGESWGRIASQYLVMGVEHLVFGYDHLLFLLCLMWIAGSFGRILLAVTGFTLAHSATLILSALSIVRLPIAPVEAVIALSIMFLAREIALGRRETLAWQHPMLISSLFGLLHGLGFAAALRDIGLPQTHLMTGLAAFNIGVEVGQVAIVGAVFALLALGRRVAPLIRKHVRWSLPKGAASGFKQVTLLAVGGLSGFWLVERTIGFL
jgi:hypothetical protein